MLAPSLPPCLPARSNDLRAELESLRPKVSAQEALLVQLEESSRMLQEAAAKAEDGLKAAQALLQAREPLQRAGVTQRHGFRSAAPLSLQAGRFLSSGGAGLPCLVGSSFGGRFALHSSADSSTGGQWAVLLERTAHMPSRMEPRVPSAARCSDRMCGDHRARLGSTGAPMCPLCLWSGTRKGSRPPQSAVLPLKLIPP